MCTINKLQSAISMLHLIALVAPFFPLWLRWGNMLESTYFFIILFNWFDKSAYRWQSFLFLLPEGIFKPDLLPVYMQNLKILKKLLLSVAQIEHDQYFILSPTLLSGCLATCAFHSVHLLNVLTSGKSWLKHLLPPPWGYFDLSSTIHCQNYFLEMLFKFSESYFNTAK